MNVTITAQDAREATVQGSITVARGVTDEGLSVVFGGDTRPMADALQAAIEDGEATVAVPSWSVLAGPAERITR